MKEEALSRMILCGERSLWPVSNKFVMHDHEQRPHYGKGHVILLLTARPTMGNDRPRYCRKRLGGLLKYSVCKVA
jgi:hypothetical protein